MPAQLFSQITGGNQMESNTYDTVAAAKNGNPAPKIGFVSLGCP